MNILYKSASLHSLCRQFLKYFKFRKIIFPDAKGSIREIILPKGLDLDRPKRTRTSFTAEQLYRLEMEFQRCQYVVGRERTELARQLNLSETQVCMHCVVPLSFKNFELSQNLFFVKKGKLWHTKHLMGAIIFNSKY